MVVAFRAWKVIDGSLHSVAMGNQYWNTTTQAAECYLEHPAPNPNCHCGIYAYSHLAPTRIWLEESTAHIGGLKYCDCPHCKLCYAPAVAGAVLLTGSTMVGEIDKLYPGIQFRAEKARILALRPPLPKDLVPPVPVLDDPDFMRYVTEFGSLWEESK